MKYHILLFLGIIAFAQANTALQDNPPDAQMNEEIDRLWKQYYEQTNSSQEVQTNKLNNNKLADKILTAKRKPLDAELADLVINMSESSTQKLAQAIQECTQNPDKKCPSKALLIGPPGIGKTTYIQAVAEKAGIPLIKINSAFVADKYKDSGPDNLKSIFEAILQTKKQIIIAFDEIHCLTDGHKNQNNPNQNTSEALWFLMDQCTENPNIILVGITNDGSNMPVQLKSRFREYTFIMKSSDEVAQKQLILKYYLKKFKNKCDEKCQKSIAQSLKTAEARNVEGIVETANWLAYLGKEKGENWYISQWELEIAVETSIKAEELLDKSSPDQATKTLIAQEEAAKWAKRAAIAGTVQVIVGWDNVFKKTSSTLFYFGEAGIEFYLTGKKPNIREILTKVGRDELFKTTEIKKDNDQK